MMETALFFILWAVFSTALYIPVRIAVGRHMRRVERRRVEIDRAMRRHPAGKKRPAE